MSQDLTASLDANPHKADWSYTSIVGKLHYLEACTRPDLSYSVHQAARFSANPRIPHAEVLQDELAAQMPTARVGIYVGFSPSHARNVALVLSTTTGLVSPQYHVKLDDLFETIKGSTHGGPQGSISMIKCGFRKGPLPNRRRVESTSQLNSTLINILMYIILTHVHLRSFLLHYDYYFIDCELLFSGNY